VLSPGASRSLAGPHPRAAPQLRPNLVVEIANPSDEGPRRLTALQRFKRLAVLEAGSVFPYLHLRLSEIWEG
jgi:hypothetical protein